MLLECRLQNRSYLVHFQDIGEKADLFNISTKDRISIEEEVHSDDPKVEEVKPQACYISQSLDANTPEVGPVEVIKEERLLKK